MKYLLDTNICVYLIHDRSSGLRHHFRNLRTGDIGMSAITLSELSYGAALSHKPEENTAILKQFVATLVLAAYDDAAAEHYGAIRAELKKKEISIGTMDILIAAHAKSLDATLVTNNLRDFRRIPGLKIENWVKE